MKLEINNITKTYHNIKALDHFSVTLQEGIYGLLGPNGAGKSTLMNTICTLIKEDEGEILLDGKSILKHKKEFLNQLGYMPQYPQLYEDFTLEEYLYYIGALKNIEKSKLEKNIDYLLKEVGLKEVRNKKIKEFSGGMKQRAMLIQALLNDPKILILDEPTAGLDPKQRIKIRNLISKLGQNKIVLISTHVVSDVEFIAKKIILIKQGKCIACESPYHLQKSIQGHVEIVQIKEIEIDDIYNKNLISSLFYEGKQLYGRIVHNQECQIKGEQVFPSLEDVYLYHFGENNEDY